MRGAILLALIVLLIAAVVIGGLAYTIYKALTRIPPRRIDPDDVAQWAQQAAAEIEANPEARVLSDGTIVQPLGPAAGIYIVTIEMTTNLVDWYAVTNAPLSEYSNFVHAQPTDRPYAFYRWRLD